MPRQLTAILAKVLTAHSSERRPDTQGSFSLSTVSPTTTYELVWDELGYPPKAILGAAYEFATDQQLRSGDFEGGKSGAVRVLAKLGFCIQKKQRPAT
jgi:hypothetical protein